MSAALALRAAIRDALLADAELLAQLGADKVFDEARADAALPYLLLGDHVSRDASSGEAPAEQHELALQVWSVRSGLKQTLEIAEAAVACLDAATLSPAGHHIVNLAWLSTEAARNEGGRERFALVRFRVLTEPL
jgi:hypothetical protein